MNDVSIAISAPGATVWRVLMDVERWPEWTASMSKVDKLDPGDLAPGHRVRISQPKMPTIVWTVGEVEPGRYFDWAGTAAGVTTRASHRLDPQPGERVLVTFEVHQSGVLAPLVRLLTGRRTQHYIEMEAAGLKTTSEARPGRQRS
jgi:uncharacterized membrane protein